MDIENLFSVARSISLLFGPLVEVVVHDFKTKKIIFIEGSFSKRKLGDPSVLDDDLQDSMQDFYDTVYTKLNFDGRLLKSISIPIQEKGTLKALLCINYDVTLFQELHTITAGIIARDIGMRSTEKQPAVLFKNDWQERINQFLYQLLKKEGLQFDALSNKDKKRIVMLLYQEGAFAEKNAADYIARVLDMSRSTVFNYLRENKSNSKQ